MADEIKPATQAQLRAAALLDKLWKETTPAGQAVRAAAKEMFPEVVTPEETAAVAIAPLKAELDETKAAFAKLEKQVLDRAKADDDLRAENEMSVKIDTAVREFGLTAAGKTKMIERMKETGNYTDASAAAAWVHSKTPAPTPTDTPTWLPQAANFFGSQQKEDAFEALHTNPQKYMDDQLKEFVRDPDKYVADTFGTA